MPDPCDPHHALEMQPQVGEVDRRWIAGMRYADRQRLLMLRHEVNEPSRNVLAYEGLMDMVFELYGRIDTDGKPYDQAEARLAATLAGHRLDTSCLPGD